MKSKREQELEKKSFELGMKARRSHMEALSQND